MNVNRMTGFLPRCRRIVSALLLAGLTWIAPAWSEPEPAPSQATPWSNSPGKAEYPNASAVILKDDIQATVNADGTQELVEYDAIKLLDRTGVERFAQTSRIYDTRVETIEVTLARV